MIERRHGDRCDKDKMILKLYMEKKSQRYIAKELGCSKTAVLKRLRKLLSDSGHQSENKEETSVLTEEIPKPNYSKEHRYLRKIGTDEIFIWTKFIAVRFDMEEVKWDGKKFVVVTKVHMQTTKDLGRF